MKIKHVDPTKRLVLLEKFKKRNDQSYTKNIIDYFQCCLNEIVTSSELAQIPGKSGNPISHNIRRVFELRDEKGYELINHKDVKGKELGLKVDEWVLLKRNPNIKKVRSRGVNKRIMFEVFKRDKNQCKICGRTIDDDDPFAKNRKITLHVGHVKAHKRKENDATIINDKLDIEDFRTMCNVCNEGAKNEDIEIITLLDRVTAADIKIQKEIFDYLNSLEININKKIT